jgi:hypothetical protein
MDSAPDPEVLGVALSRYAAVIAYLSEGIALEVALSHAAIEADRWSSVSAAWGTKLAESTRIDTSLVDLFDYHCEVARANVERPLPPLDVDYRAFARFFLAFCQSASPLDFLADRGMVENDIFRLQALWQTRLAEDEELRKSAGAAWADEGGVPEVHPSPARLRGT